MKHWRTSLSGLATAFFAFVAFSPALFTKWPWIVELAKFFMIGGFGCIGWFANDAAAKPELPPELTSAVNEWAKAQQGLPSARDLDVAGDNQAQSKGAGS